MKKELQKIFDGIDEYNQKVYDSYKPNDKLDRAKFKKNWGMDVIPFDLQIDPNKEYITESGLKVSNIHIILRNDNGNEVTYPVKGTIHTFLKNGTPIANYETWTIDGRNDVMKNKNNYNLKEK